MERRGNQNVRNRLNSQVLPVILYLTIPGISNKNRVNGKRIKSEKQKLRDMKRLQNYIDRKSICPLFPFYSLENTELLTLMPKHLPAQKSDSLQMNTLQQDILDLKSANAAMNKDLTYAYSKLEASKCEASTLQDCISQQQDTLRSLEIEISNLQKDVCQKTRQQLEFNREILNLKEENGELREKFNREIDNNERIRGEHCEEVKCLKTEIRTLKMQKTDGGVTSTQCKSSGTTPACKKHGTIGTKHNIPKSAPQSSGKTNKGSGCNRCGSLYLSHQPNQCPARNFVCGKCSRRGHHTLNCLQVCKGCGGTYCHRPEDCGAYERNCAYCNVRGHFSVMCLKKRFDEEGF